MLKIRKWKKINKDLTFCIYLKIRLDKFRIIPNTKNTHQRITLMGVFLNLILIIVFET
jgi:hypothetical protein